MPAATETFRLSTAPSWGRPTRKSQFCRVKCRSPEPSAPSASTTGPARSTSSARFAAATSAPTTQRPASLRSLSVRARLVTDTTGVVSAAPTATLRALGVSCAARSRGTMTASAPQASALRRQAPRLCGSCPSPPRTPSSPKVASAPFIPRPAARLGARLLPLGERQIDEALDGVHRGHHHPDMGAGAQAPSRALAAPGVTVVLHHVPVVPQIVDMKQPVDRYIEDLHEPAELHHGGNQALERLSDPLLK